MRQTIEKSHKQLRKQILNKKKRFTNFIDKSLINQHSKIDLVNMNELNYIVNMNELNDLTQFIDSNIKEVKKS